MYFSVLVVPIDLLGKRTFMVLQCSLKNVCFHFKFYPGNTMTRIIFYFLVFSFIDYFFENHQKKEEGKTGNRTEYIVREIRS